MRIKLAGILIFLSFNSSAAFYKCDSGKFVKTGDSKSEVIIKCGSPTLSEQVGYKKVDDTLITIEQLTYKSKQKHAFLKHLIFHGGKLVDIKTGDKAD